MGSIELPQPGEGRNQRPPHPSERNGFPALRRLRRITDSEIFLQPAAAPRVGPLMADSVEEVRPRQRRQQIAAQIGRLSCRIWLRHWDQLSQFSKVLGGCCEEELVAGTIWST